MPFLTIYLAGSFATATGSWFADRAVDAQQRLPLSCHLLLGVGWPVYVGFLACVNVAAGRRARTAGAAADEG